MPSTSNAFDAEAEKGISEKTSTEWQLFSDNIIQPKFHEISPIHSKLALVPNDAKSARVSQIRIDYVNGNYFVMNQRIYLLQTEAEDVGAE